jgi:uncharacterized protein (TIGR01777 family)
MKILISGSTGFLGSALVEALHAQGHSIVRLARPATRRPPAANASETWLRWDPLAGDFDSAAAEGADAMVHLAGASIGEGRWNEARKRLLRTSRVNASRHLISALAHLKRPPKVMISPSGIGYYGDRAEEELTEESAPGNDFLAQLCREWEAEVQLAEQFGTRVVQLRFGIILAKHGGALARMLLPFRLGAGGRFGSGRQWMSWLSLTEALAIIGRTLVDAQLHGPVNAVAPNPVRNAEFVAALARALHRPAIFPAPAFALRLALGEMADPLLLFSQRVLPRKLEAAGHPFRHRELPEALEEALA